MKIKTENKVITQEIVTYIAEDGLEFNTEKSCFDYEEKLSFKKDTEAAEKFRIKDFDEMLPLSNDGLLNENNTFRWYKVNKEDDFNIINKAYSNSLSQPSTYPETICVETYGYEEYMDAAYDYHMTTCRKITEEFWKRLGYKISFEKESE